jgi:hypothetical protein
MRRGTIIIEKDGRDIGPNGCFTALVGVLPGEWRR